MNINPITIIIIMLFVYPILKGFFLKFSSNSLKQDMQQVGSNIAFIAALFLGIYFSRKFLFQHHSGIYKKVYDLLPEIVSSLIETSPSIVYFVVIPIMIAIFYRIFSWLLETINRLSIYKFLDGIEELIQAKSNIFKRSLGAMFQLPRAICYVLLVTFLLNIISMFNIGLNLNEYLETSKPYNYLCKEIVIPITSSKVAKELPNIINNSFKIVVKETSPHGNTGNETNTSRTIIYYNGVTLEEGIKSNSEIDSYAKNIAASESTDKLVAKKIYTWVGSNISYDNDKANKVLNNDFEIKSGAIPTFYTRKGICFDYACLYVAMTRANGLKVRLVTGEGFNGVSWVSHAWNQVYIPEEDAWINVDPTFYKGGYYFNNKRFDKDHRNAKVVGQW